MKQKKILLNLLRTSSLLSLPIFTIAISSQCDVQDNSKKDSDVIDNNNKEKDGSSSAKTGSNTRKDSSSSVEIDNSNWEKFEKNIESIDNLESIANLEFYINGFKRDKSQVLPTEAKENIDAAKINVKNNQNIMAYILNIETEKNANATGQIAINVQFQDNESKKIVTKKYTVSGFKTNNGQHHSSTIPSVAAIEKNELFKYQELSQKDRFLQDNKKYMESLKRQISTDGDFKSARPELSKTSHENIKKFNDLAEKVGFDTYENAAFKGFTLPVYNDKGDVEGLMINDRPETNKGPSSIDSYGREHEKTNGLARTIPNEAYKTMIEQTFQVKITSKNMFTKEINEAQSYINWAKRQRDKNFKEWLETQEKQHNINRDDELEKLNKRLQNAPESVKDGIRKIIEETKTKFENDWKEFVGQYGTKDLFIKTFQKNIEEYKEKAAKDTENKLSISENGTMWILDYAIDSNGATKFYFGTNSHVAKALTEKLLGLSILRINNNVGVGDTFRISELDPNFTRFIMSPKENNGFITKIFDGTDFMKTKPSDFLADEQKSKFQDVEEFIDFAILEIDFSKLNLATDVTVLSNNQNKTGDWKNKTHAEFAKYVTNDYEKNTSKHIKFLSKPFLDNYESVDRKLIFNQPEEANKELDKVDQIFIAGYPTSEGDYFLEKYVEQDQIDQSKWNFSLWVNSDYRYYKKLAKKEGQQSSYTDSELNRGNFLSYQIGYRSFIDKPGVTDAFLAVSRVGNELYNLDGKKYINYGLTYMPRFYAPAGGASGSSARAKENKVFGVVHASNNTAKTSLIAALRSNGHDYQKLFGNYNLPQYDLIYGGGKDQKKSYREALKEKYKSNSSFRTNIFKDGFEETNIPEEFKFKNNQKNR
ncbi:DUF31 family protein [Mycoplasma sp. U97]|uniref:Ig-specific serine endopeptidase MIP n=1 Tax=Mycoplasma tauri TaxID=547987 RepID=UPI001CC0F690|nr:DUF31 family protein [Mycoplasma tauri]MBZ4212484.1 DUF31 family protein [Mycoplasma tauri]